MMLEVGTVLYCESRWPDGWSKCVIDRVTAKRAFSGNIEFEKEQKSGSFHSRGSSGWDSPTYRLETQEVKQAWYRYTLERKFEKIKPKELTIEQLEAINGIVMSKGM